VSGTLTPIYFIDPDYGAVLMLEYVTRLAKTGLVCTKWQGMLFTTNQLLHLWTNDPCVCHCQWFPGLLFLGLFSWPVWCARVLGWSSNGSGVNGQVSTWLEIATRLARRLGHQIDYCMWYLELKWASGETFWHVNFNTWKNPPLPWLPTTPDLHPYMIICDSGIKTI